jgi:hypothetical protein
MDDGYIFLSCLWPASRGLCLMPTESLPWCIAIGHGKIKIPANQRARFPWTAIQPRGRGVITVLSSAPLPVVCCIRVWRATAPALLGLAADGLGKGARGRGSAERCPILTSRCVAGPKRASRLPGLGCCGTVGCVFDRGAAGKESCVSFPGRCCSRH